MYVFIRRYQRTRKYTLLSTSSTTASMPFNNYVSPSCRKQMLMSDLLTTFMWMRESFLFNSGETELLNGILAVVLDVNRIVYLRVRLYRRMKTYILYVLEVSSYQSYCMNFFIRSSKYYRKKIQMCQIIIQQRGASSLKGKVV